LSHDARPTRRSIPSTRIITTFVSALLVFGVISIARPTDVLGATAYKTAVCSAGLRTSASTSAFRRVLIPAGTRVSVVATVTGGWWRTSCAGRYVSARSWYRISYINGKSVESLYGMTYLYAATSLFKPTPVTKYAACSAALHTSPSKSATIRAIIPTDTKVLVATSVAGTSWSTTCTGSTVSGSAWYRISAIGSRTVKAIYGVTYLYAPLGKFKAGITATAPTAGPTTITGTTVTVSSIPALLSALADNNVGLIVVANGTYHVSTASSEHSDALWIGARFAARTRPITVRAATAGSVTFDGGGATYFTCIAFSGGAHDQTWDGFNCAHGQATNTGIVTFGGYTGMAAPHHITMRRIAILSTCTGRSTSVASPTTDHAFYLTYAVGGPHDLLFEDVTVNGAGHLSSAFHFYHSDSTNRNAWNVTVRRLHVSGTQQAVILWDPTLRNITFDTAAISNALDVAVRYETTGSTGIHFNNITSTASGNYGFYSSQGTAPAGLTFSNDVFH
jgi:hypothetical protein